MRNGIVAWCVACSEEQHGDRCFDISLFPQGFKIEQLVCSVVVYTRTLYSNSTIQ